MMFSFLFFFFQELVWAGARFLECLYKEYREEIKQHWNTEKNKKSPEKEVHTVMFIFAATPSILPGNEMPAIF